MRRLASSILVLHLLLNLASPVEAVDEGSRSLRVTSVPESERERLNLDTHYQKYCSAEGFPVVASSKVSDFALLEAAYLINHMLQDRADIREALIKAKIRFAVMAPDEFTLDIPEHSHLRPVTYWQKRARGLGSTYDHPAVSCGEENLLELKGDPYKPESILIHEFAHTIHQQGLDQVDPTFDDRLRKTYEKARARGLWGGKLYAGTNHSEYWAEGVQTWFECNRENDEEHNEVNTRAELREYDPGIAALLEEVFGTPEWTWTKPSERDVPDHLAGFDRDNALEFRWPPEVLAGYEAYQKGEGLTPLEPLPLSRLEGAKSPRSEVPTFIRARNNTGKVVNAQWIDYEGQLRSYGKIGDGRDWNQSTEAGHLWLFTDQEGKPLGLYEAIEEDCRVDLKAAIPVHQKSPVP